MSSDNTTISRVEPAPRSDTSSAAPHDAATRIDRERMLFQGVEQPFVHDRAAVDVALHAGEVLVRIDLATICGSDAHTFHGRRPGLVPSVLGHEAVGTVVAVGDDRPRSLVGRRVTWTLVDTCGRCRPCTEWGIPQKCESLFKYGHAGLDDTHGLDGCFASHIVLRAGTTVVEVPDALADSTVVPANCALATMVAVVEKVPAGADRVLIQGAGLLGIYGAALLRSRGVREVWISDAVASRLDLAAEFGAHGVLARETERFADHSFDAVIEVAGVAKVVHDGIRLLRPGGTYVLAGLVHPDSLLDIKGVDLIAGCITMVGVHNYAARHLREAVDFLTVHEYPWELLVSPPLPLARLDDAFAETNTRDWLRVAVRPD
ncbi:zinc-binding dehydrogenase [Ilumatobacter nonamiensis]|uniref:zinc-binding dehydrogenase n=1 Tax=Ilumatobacter nonamiensis TaxID=467093 RepID=UPI00034A43DB|nr:zinc-binding dehydrogenase [Ilumatobacter nonamiensis]